MSKYVSRCSCYNHQVESERRDNYCCNEKVEPAYTREKPETMPFISDQVHCNNSKKANRCSTCGEVQEVSKKCRCSEHRNRCDDCHSNRCRCRRRRSWISGHF